MIAPDVGYWLELLKLEDRKGEQMRKDVAAMLAEPEIRVDQVKALFRELEKQTDFVERLASSLEEKNYDFDVISAAERLEDKYADLAAKVAEKLKDMI